MSNSGSNASSAPRVLVVDDSAIMRKMVIHSLKVAGVEVSGIEQAAHGAEALSIIERSSLDLVLCDVHMPTMDGVQLVRELAQRGRIGTLPVVLISSERNAALQAELTRLGARGYLHKPFYPETLGKVVRDVLETRQAS